MLTKKREEQFLSKLSSHSSLYDHYSSSALRLNPGPSKVAANPTVPSPRSPQNAHCCNRPQKRETLPAYQVWQIKSSIRHRASSPSTGSDKQRKSELPPKTGVADHPPTAAEVLLRVAGQQRGSGRNKQAKGQAREAGIGLLRGTGQARQS